MIVYEYTKNGDRIDKKARIKPTQEMQEVLDAFWNTVKITSESSTPYTEIRGLKTALDPDIMGGTK